MKILQEKRDPMTKFSWKSTLYTPGEAQYIVSVNKSSVSILQSVQNPNRTDIIVGAVSFNQLVYMLLCQAGPALFQNAASYSRINPYRVRPEETGIDDGTAYYLDYLEYNEDHAGYVSTSAPAITFIPSPNGVKVKLDAFQAEKGYEFGYFIPDLIDVLRFIIEKPEYRSKYTLDDRELMLNLIAHPYTIKCDDLLKTYDRIKFIKVYFDIDSIKEAGYHLPFMFYNTSPFIDQSDDEEEEEDIDEATELTNDTISTSLGKRPCADDDDDEWM